MDRILNARGALYLGLACVISCASASDDAPAIDPDLELLVAGTNQIERIQPHANRRSIVVRSNDTIVDVDYFYSKRLIFWIADSRVFSTDWDEAGNARAIITPKSIGAWEPLGLAVDFLGERLYVADALGRKIDAFNLKGKNHMIIAAEEFERPSGLVVDPEAGLAFIADSDKIFRMNLDGTSRYPIVRKSAASSVTSLAIDLASKTLFWWDAELRAIESASYIGESRRVLHANKRAAVSGLALSQSQHVYFADGSSVFRADDQRKTEKLLEASQPIRNLRTLDAELQRTGKVGPCSRADGGCQHACVAASCRCYVRHLLAADGRSCRLARELLLYSRGELVRGRGLEPGAEVALSFASPGSLSLNLDADFESGALYFADARNNTVYRADLKSGQTEPVVAYEGSASISLDLSSRNLYYTDLTEGTLNVVSLRNYAHRRPLLDSLNEPSEVIVHPRRGHVYFYDDARIKRVNTDGAKLTTIYRPRPHHSLRLALDSAEERVYWCLNDLERPSRNSSIQHSALDGSELTSLKTPQLRDVSAMLVHEQWIYAVAAGYEKLVRLRKVDGRQMTEIASGERRGFYALAVMRPADELEQNPCASATACDKLCFAVPRTKSRPGLARQCACPRGERLVGKFGKRICKPEDKIKELALVHRCEPDWEFTCRNGRCIPKTQVCDGVNDCLDRSDERGCSNAEVNFFNPG